ncbi:hypothetical protein ACWCYY_31820 [Kitasatospora sp. NPDC001664]
MRSDRAGEPDTGPDWGKRLLLGTVALAVLVAAYFLLAATVPRWWSQRVGDAVDGRLSTGLVIGLALGVSCTLLPLVVAWFGLRSLDGTALPPARQCRTPEPPPLGSVGDPGPGVGAQPTRVPMRS